MKLAFYLLLFYVYINMVSCIQHHQIPLKIAVSKASGSENYEKYAKWLKQANSNIEIIDLYTMNFDSAVSVMNNVDGLLLTGGSDVHPKYYNRDSAANRCSTNVLRDSLEMEIIKQAVNLDLPILAICRGQQILNVAFQGSLIVDIAEDVPESKIIHQKKDEPAFHKISVKKNSLLYEITNEESGQVNSYHHQCVDSIGNSLTASSYTNDKLVESIEYKDYKNKPFLLGVQWHPELMKYSNPFSLKLAEEFIKFSNIFQEKRFKKTGVLNNTYSLTIDLTTILISTLVILLITYVF